MVTVKRLRFDGDGGTATVGVPLGLFVGVPLGLFAVFAPLGLFAVFATGFQCKASIGEVQCC